MSENVETAVCGQCGRTAPPRPARELWKGCAACRGERCGALGCGKAKADAAHNPYDDDSHGFITEREQVFFCHGACADGMRGAC